MRETLKQIMEDVKYDGRPRIVDNNTVEYQRDGSRVIRLHHTDILTFAPDGAVTYDTGGWWTVTTKDRFNRHVPGGPRVWSDRGKRWIGSFSGDKVEFFDGITWKPGEGFLNARQVSPNFARERRLLKRRINAYATAFSKALPISPPNGGDCWGCLFRSEAHANDPRNFVMGTGHLIEHLGGTEDQPEPYFVPSLLLRAMQAAGAGPAWHAAAFHDDPLQLLRHTATFKRWIVRFLTQALHKELFA